MTTPLVERLRAADKMVVGFGRRASISKEFTNACTHFVALEDFVRLAGQQKTQLRKAREEHPRGQGSGRRAEDGDEEAAASKKAKADADAFLRSMGVPRESE